MILYYFQIAKATGKLRSFIIEPFLPHKPVSCATLKIEPLLICVNFRLKRPMFAFTLTDLVTPSSSITKEALTSAMLTPRPSNWRLLLGRVSQQLISSRHFWPKSMPPSKSIFFPVPSFDTLLLFCSINSLVANFIESLYQQYVDLYFTYLEINPLVITGGKVYVLDLAAKLDATADFICRSKWGEIDYPPPFGRDAFPEEAYIADLDSKSGASLKVRVQG